MSDWEPLVVDNYQAANELFGLGRWRSCTNRAYYAAYAAATDTLIEQGISVGSARFPNPSHEALRNLVLNNWSDPSLAHRSVVFAMLDQLFWLRVMADYGPSYRVDDTDARSAMGFMVNIVRMLEGSNAGTNR